MKNISSHRRKPVLLRRPLNTVLVTMDLHARIAVVKTLHQLGSQKQNMSMILK